MDLKNVFGIKKNILEEGEMDGIPFEIGMVSSGMDSGQLIASTNKNGGSAPTDDTGTLDATTTKSVKVTLTDNDESCVWAYEHDDTTFIAVSKLASLVNTGFKIIIKNEKEMKPYMVEFEKDMKMLRKKIEPTVTNLYLHCFSFIVS